MTASNHPEWPPGGLAPDQAMRETRYARPGTLQAALSLWRRDPQARALGGGTDLLPLSRIGAIDTATLVDLRLLPLQAIHAPSDAPSDAPGGGDLDVEVDVAAQGDAQSRGLDLGAGVTADAAIRHPGVQRHAPLLAQALLAAASPAIRHRATLAGNLMQAPRCPWYRAGAPECNRRQPGTGCAAQAARSAEGGRWLSLVGADARCAAAAPSDAAVALAALGATLTLTGADGARRIPLTALWATAGERDGPPPGSPRLRPGELITAIHVPADGNGACRLSRFSKVRDRVSFEFAVVSVAVQLQLSAPLARPATGADAPATGQAAAQPVHIVAASVWAGGIAPVPWRLPEVEQALTGRTWPLPSGDGRPGADLGPDAGPASPALAIAALALASPGASPPPLPGTAFKRLLLQRTLARTLLEMEPTP